MPDALTKADWGRFQRNPNVKRCLVCGKSADVSVKLTATELGASAGKTGVLIVTETLHYCHTHGVLRYGDALRRLQGSDA